MTWAAVSLITFLVPRDKLYILYIIKSIIYYMVIG